MPDFIDLTGKQFGEWTAQRYIGKSVWECINGEGKIKNIHSYALRTKYSNFTTVNKKEPPGVKGKTFNYWTVLEYLGKGFWKCQCKCGEIGKVNTLDLKNGKSTKCSKCSYRERLTEDLTGKQINEWTVLYYAGNMKWHCKCSCGKERDINGKYLYDRSSKSCGHDRNYHIVRDDITGKRFGSLTVLRYSGKDNMWVCQCDCTNIVKIHRNSLITGKTKSCGCLKEELRRETLLDRYGDTNTTRIHNPREEWQIKTLEDKDLLKQLIDSLTCKVTAVGIAELLGVNDTTIIKALNKFGLQDEIEHNSGISDLEIEVLNYITNFGFKVEQGNREILHGLELDLYIPEKKLAIEFNGSYWHCSKYKDKNYHRDKTLECIKNNIHLIHIFEYEWKDLKTREKLLNYLNLLLSNNSIKISGRKTKIGYIDTEICSKFLDEYHLQGNASAQIKIGCSYNNELIGVMTFSKPRFSNEYDYELVRLCWKPGYKVIGGAEKIFKAFISEYKPNSIVSYCDIGKFTGTVYNKLGFTLNEITEPGYVWIDIHSNEVLTRYQTMKHKLIEQGLDKYGNTEDEIMTNLGYLKIYNSGNIKFIWKV